MEFTVEDFAQMVDAEVMLVAMEIVEQMLEGARE